VAAYANIRGSFRLSRRRGKVGDGNGENFAALDLGTNSCRLLVARPQADGFRVVDSFSRIVRLGEGLGTTGRLPRKAIERTIDALKVCADKMHRNGVSYARCVATEACRRASNCAEFLDQVSSEAGFEIEIISSDEETRLALEGCMPLFDHQLSHGLMFDIGGGSTELMWLSLGKGGKATRLDWLSLPFGVVTLSEDVDGRSMEEVYIEMVDHVYDHLGGFDRRHDITQRIDDGDVQMLGTSGTVTTLSALNMELDNYNRGKVDGSYLTFDEINCISRDLVGMENGDRAALSCIGPQRADLVVAGCAILAALCRKWPLERLRVADRGLREGILLGLFREALGADAQSPYAWPSTSSLTPEAS